MGGKKKGGKKKDAGRELPVYKYEPMPRSWPGKLSDENLFASFVTEVRISINATQTDQFVCIHVRQVNWEFHSFFITLPKRATVYRLQCEIAKVQHLSSVLPQDVVIYREHPPDPLAGGSNDEWRSAAEPAGAPRKPHFTNNLGGGVGMHNDNHHDLNFNAGGASGLGEKFNSDIFKFDNTRSQTAVVCEDPTVMLCDFFPEIAAFRESHHDPSQSPPAGAASQALSIPSTNATSIGSSLAHGQNNPRKISVVAATESAYAPGHDDGEDTHHTNDDGNDGTHQQHDSTTGKPERARSARSRGSKRSKGSRPASAMSDKSEVAAPPTNPPTGGSSVQFMHNLRPRHPHDLGGGASAATGGNGINADFFGPNATTSSKKNAATMMFPLLRPTNVKSAAETAMSRRATLIAYTQPVNAHSTVKELLRGPLDRAHSKQMLNSGPQDPQELPIAVTIYYDIAPYISKKNLIDTKTESATLSETVGGEFMIDTVRSKIPRFVVDSDTSNLVQTSRSRRPSLMPTRPKGRNSIQSLPSILAPVAPELATTPSKPMTTLSNRFDIECSILMRNTREWQPRKVFTAFETAQSNANTVGAPVEMGFQKTIRTLILLKSLVRRRKKVTQNAIASREKQPAPGGSDSDEDSDDDKSMVSDSASSIANAPTYKTTRSERPNINDGLDKVMSQITTSMRNV